MASAVNARLVRVLDADARTARRRLNIVVLLLLAAAVAVGLLVTMDALHAVGAVVFTVSAMAGIAIGWAVASGRLRQRSRSLRDAWTGWMEAANQADRVPTLHAQASGRDPKRISMWLWVAIGALVWAAHMGLFWLAAADTLLAALPVLILDGLLAGLLAGAWAAEARWCGRLKHSLNEMIDEGELSLEGHA